MKIKDPNKLYLFDLAEELDKAERMGSNEDHPEGYRYIKMSDTWAKRTVKDLRAIVEDE